MDAVELLQDAKDIPANEMPTNQVAMNRTEPVQVKQENDMPTESQSDAKSIADDAVVPVSAESVSQIEESKNENGTKNPIPVEDFEKAYQELLNEIEDDKEKSKDKEEGEEINEVSVPYEKYKSVLDNAQEMAIYIEDLEKENREQKILIEDLTYEKSLISDRAKKYQEKATIVDEEQYERLVPEQVKEIVEAARWMEKVNDEYSKRAFRQKIKVLAERTFGRPLDDYIQDATVDQVDWPSESMASYSLPTASKSSIWAKNQAEKQRLDSMAELF